MNPQPQRFSRKLTPPHSAGCRDDGPAPGPPRADAARAGRPWSSPSGQTSNSLDLTAPERNRAS